MLGIIDKIFNKSNNKNNYKNEKNMNDEWFINTGTETIKCGVFGYGKGENFDKCSFSFINEYSKKLIFNNLWKYRIDDSIHIYIKTDKNEYTLLKNETTKNKPLDVYKLQGMILIVDTLFGMYIYNDENARFIPNVLFHRISKDYNKVVCKKFDSSMNRTIGFQEFSLSSTAPEYKTKKKYYTHDKSIYPINIKHIINDEIEIYFSDNSSKASIIAQEYFKHQNKLVRLENDFDDDDTLNFKVTIDYNNKEELGFAHYLESKCKRLSIYGVEVQTILDVVTNSYNYQKYNYMTQEQNEYLKQTCNMIVDKLKNDKNMTTNEILQYLYDKYIYNQSNNTEFVGMMLKINGYDFKKHGSAWKEKYNNLFDDVIKQNKITVKWKSEYQLYSLVKSKFPDAIYQYRCDWLGFQSFDIFIPSLNVAIEYQGQQHYEPIAIFGGVESYERQKKLDIRKKQLCNEHNIKLIEWRYSEPISKILLQQKLEK